MLTDRTTYLHHRLVAHVDHDGVVVREFRRVNLQSVLDALVLLVVREVVLDCRAVVKLEGAFVVVAPGSSFSFMKSFVESLFHLRRSFDIYSCIRSLIHPFIHPFIYLFYC